MVTMWPKRQQIKIKFWTKNKFIKISFCQSFWNFTGVKAHSTQFSYLTTYLTTLQILDAVIMGRILLYFIANALELFCIFRYDIAELYWFCMDFYCAVLWKFVIMKWRPSRSEEYLHVSNYFLEYCDGILPNREASVNACAGVLLHYKPCAVKWNFCWRDNKNFNSTRSRHFVTSSMLKLL
jgi:hypothetical protein